MIHIFIVGSKGIPAQYGGFETFVENLTLRKKSGDIKYHVSCMNNDEKHFEHNEADCFNVRVPLKGAPGRIFHVSLVLDRVEKWCRQNPGNPVIVYILGCRIGPLLIPHAWRLHRLGAVICCNPDGLEWKRDKWNTAAKLFLRYCESCLVRYSDLVICDAVNIEKYIKQTYKNKVKTTAYISYGADVQRSLCSDSELETWYQKHEIIRNEYYLIVGRFVPENNYETMITEFMRSSTSKDLVIITNVEKNKFYDMLLEKTGFDKDKRIKFVGTVYEPELLKKIREEAYGYIHGHEVGGTNPSLLEALASTRINLLLGVGFNKEVGENGAFYWSKETGNLAGLIEKVEALPETMIEKMNDLSTKRVVDHYSWQKICREYEKVWKRFK